MGYTVLHLEKASGGDGGMSSHIERKIAPSNANAELTHLNEELIEFPDEVQDRTQAIQHRINTAHLQRKISKNQVRAIRVLLTGSHEDMKGIVQNGRLDEWCKDNLDWLRDTYGVDNVVSAVLHMDEKTPHIHATVVPIVTGERRKAKAETKYRKKSTTANRLCADDLMVRPKLKEYQNSYAEKMRKYGLQRGIDGSEAKHITTSQYYKELFAGKGDLQNDIAVLLNQQEQSRKQLNKIKGEIKTEKLKTIAVDVANDTLEGIGSMFSNAKTKKLQQEIDVLKSDKTVLKNEIGTLKQTMQELKKEHDTTVSKLRAEIKYIYDRFPSIREIFRMEILCKTLGFGKEIINTLLTKKPVMYKGDIYSVEHKRSFQTQGSILQIENSPTEPKRLRLTVDRYDLFDWFKLKYSELMKRNSVRAEKERPIIKQTKGRKI